MLRSLIRLGLAFLAMLALAVLWTAATPATAGAAPPGLHLVPAQVVEPTDTAVTSEDVIRVAPAFLAFIVGSLMPLLTALLTKVNASSAVKGTLNLVLSIIGGVVSAFVTAGDAGLTVLQIGTAAIAAYLASQVAYSGLWKPTGATGAIADSSKGIGLG